MFWLCIFSPAYILVAYIFICICFHSKVFYLIANFPFDQFKLTTRPGQKPHDCTVKPLICKGLVAARQGLIIFLTF